MYSEPSVRSMRTECRWVNVPRRESLTGQTHIGALEHERAEREQLGERPVDMPLAGHLPPALEHRLDPLMGVKPWPGTFTKASPMRSSTDFVDGRLDLERGCRGPAPPTGSVQERSVRVPDLVGRRAELTLVVPQGVSASLVEMSPRPIRASVWDLRTPFLVSITSYIAGCVIDGSSPLVVAAAAKHTRSMTTSLWNASR